MQVEMTYQSIYLIVWCNKEHRSKNLMPERSRFDKENWENAYKLHINCEKLDNFVYLCKMFIKDGIDGEDLIVNADRKIMIECSTNICQNKLKLQ